MATEDTAPRTIIAEEEEFLQDVEEFMKQRGVPFDRDGKVAGRPAPLHKLYKLVLERGGYDAVSGERMTWREICSHYNFPKQHDGAMAYQLKLLYYKNLAAYEIEKYWGETPPPPQLLEHTTAKGGDVRKRTYESMAAVEPNNSQDSDSMVIDSPQKTPKQERPEPDEQGSATRYPSRLRQHPKPVQVYQPDPTPSRAARMRNTHSPQPPNSYTQPSFSNASSNPRDPNFKLEHYEPRPAVPLSLKSVLTPGSNPDVFYQRKQMAKIAPVQRSPLPQDLLRFTLPKPAFDGPNIYVRCVQGLKSGLEREEDFALHHLVKVSHERGDKFKFEGFPTLAEALMEKVVQVTDLAYAVPFHVSYMDTWGRNAPNTLNAVHGTRNLPQLLASLTPRLLEGELEPEGYLRRLDKINEATLVIRNMVTLEDNAIFLSKMALYKDLLLLLLSLPDQSRFNEIKQYALDMAEMTTRYWQLVPKDDLYLALVRELSSGDRGKVMRALGAIYRFDAEADRVHPLNDIPLSTLEELCQFCLLEDDELVEAVVNFLYAWSAFPESVRSVLHSAPNLVPNIVPQLTKLLIKGASVHVEAFPVERRQTPVAPTLAPPSIPIVPNDLFQQMLAFQEPERSTRWLRGCFEEAPHADVTQISIWQAYQTRFLHNNHIPAAEFIKQVSATIPGAQAQVVQGPQGSRFIIKGIRPRRILVGLHGQPYYKCQWEVPLQTPPNYTGPSLATKVTACAQWSPSPEALWKHLLSDHAKIPMTSDGKFRIKDVPTPDSGYACRWINCHKHNRIDSPSALGLHFRMHVPETPEQHKELILKLAGDKPPAEGDVIVSHSFLNTAVDERNIPTGIPFMSALLLNNFARYVGRYGGAERQRKELMGRIFDAGVRQDLWNVFSKQRTIAGLVIDILNNIRNGEASEKKSSKQDEANTGLF